jgi:hypothetical protein
MTSEQQASKELIVRNWSFTYFEGLDRLDKRLKELEISPEQVLQLIEATSELKDIDFRVAVFDLLELMKRTGRSSKEAEAYIKELDAQIIFKEKQSSDWAAKIEKTEGEFRDWEQKRNDERAKFESEQAQNKRALKEDGEKLNRELGKNNEVRENIEETIALKAELKSVGLDLPTFKAIVLETIQGAGISLGIGRKIKEDIKKFGSLYKVIAKKEAEEKSKTRTLQWLDGEIAKRHQTIRKQNEEVEAGAKLIAEQLKSIECWKALVEKNKWQYEFFQLFISMLLTSPSASESAEALGVTGFRGSPLAALGLRIRVLSEKGWTHSKEGTPEERRAGFVVIVMGVYLHSIHCSKCGASFIVNKASNAYSSYRSYYYCPVCDSGSYTKADDTFFNLMVSPELTKKFQDMKNLLDMMGKTDLEALMKKLKVLDSLPSEVYKALSEGRRIEVKVLDGTN